MEDDSFLSRIILQLVLIIINAVFSAAEIALISVNETKLEKRAAEGNKAAARVVKLKKTPEKFLATIQVCITLAGFLASAFAADSFSYIFVDFLTTLNEKLPFLFSPDILKTFSLVIITVILSLFTIIFGELVPKRLAMKKAESLAYFSGYLLRAASIIFSPLVWFLSLVTNFFLKILRINPNQNEIVITEEEIRMMIDAGSKKGAIEANEKEYLNNIFEFDDRTAGELMTHRLKTVILYLKDNDKEWEKTIIEARHTFYPVCGDTIDDLRGVLSTRDYLLLNSHTREVVMERAVHNAQFVPESAKADVLFAKMKESGNHFALVLDEYGGFSGVLTMNNLLSSIVGAF